ncbi:MAG TPA: phenylalanine--tRNA ligase subunit beta [Patescibacteria group bacterium]|nr:phenylalanine--tRNA ligase subunit beta [Patescibacteria group bacterium]
MKVPFNWLKEYIDIKKTPGETAESLTALGLMLDKPIEDNVLDLEHRMDRSDWLSIIGVARDLAAFENLKLKYPPVYSGKGKEGGGVEIKVESPDLCYRFNTRVFRGIKVQESPNWLKERLIAYGMTPINNIVDITNYVMLEFGNTLHAQDLSKFEKQEIVIRRARDGEEVTTLDGTLLKMDDSMLVLSQNEEAIVVGGVVGGSKTAVDFNTVDIVLDTGNYNQANVRKTARKLKVQNESVLRNDKFLHPKNTEPAIERATQLILELAGGTYYENYDYYPNPLPDKQMSLRLDRIKTIGGISFDFDWVKEILKRLEYRIIDEKEDTLLLEVPYFRTDVEVEDDIVSDLLRINDYSKITAAEIDTAPPGEITSKTYKYQERLRDTLVNLGLHEHITDPLVSYNEINKNRVWLENSFSSEKNALRTTLYETLLPVFYEYRKHGVKEAGLFEIGNVYEHTGIQDDYDNYKETLLATIIYRNTEKDPYGISKEIKKLLSGLFLVMGIPNYRIEKSRDKAFIYITNDRVGYITYDSFTLDIEKLANAPTVVTRVHAELRNPVTEDLSITTDLTKSLGNYLEIIKNADPQIVKAEVIDEYFDMKVNKRSALIRIYFTSSETSPEQVKRIKENILDKIKT